MCLPQVIYCYYYYYYYFRKKSEKSLVSPAMLDNKSETRTPSVSSNVPSASNVRGKSTSGNPKGTPKWFKTGR